MKRDYIPWLIILGVVAAYLFSKFLNKPTNATDLNMNSQRGVFQTDTGLYGANVAEGISA